MAKVPIPHDPANTSGDTLHRLDQPGWFSSGSAGSTTTGRGGVIRRLVHEALEAYDLDEARGSDVIGESLHENSYFSAVRALMNFDDAERTAEAESAIARLLPKVIESRSFRTSFDPAAIRWFLTSGHVEEVEPERPIDGLAVDAARYPALAAALRRGTIGPDTLPDPTRRTVRFHDDVPAEDEQVQSTFADAQAAPDDFARRSHL